MTLNAQSVPSPDRPDLCLFATSAFYNLRRGMVPVGWETEHGSIVGNMPFSTFWSGDSAPFCGFDWKAAYPPEVVQEQTDELVRLIGDRFIRIGMKPPHWSINEQAALITLLARGFVVERADLNQWIDLPTSVDDYVAGLKHSARVALDRTSAAFSTFIARDVDEWTAGYDLLAANRANKGRKLSLDLDYVLALRETFGDLVTMIVCVDDDQWRAVAVLYRVGRGRAMTQWWGDKPGLEGRSPMNVLARACVAHSIETGARTLDLGISSSAGVVDAGLARFKRSVGAKSEVRYVVAR